MMANDRVSGCTVTAYQIGVVRFLNSAVVFLPAPDGDQAPHGLAHQPRVDRERRLLADWVNLNAAPACSAPTSRISPSTRRFWTVGSLQLTRSPLRGSSKLSEASTRRPSSGVPGQRPRRVPVVQRPGQAGWRRLGRAPAQGCRAVQDRRTGSGRLARRRNTCPVALSRICSGAVPSWTDCPTIQPGRVEQVQVVVGGQVGQVDLHHAGVVAGRDAVDVDVALSVEGGLDGRAVAQWTGCCGLVVFWLRTAPRLGLRPQRPGAEQSHQQDQTQASPSLPATGERGCRAKTSQSPQVSGVDAARPRRRAPAWHRYPQAAGQPGQVTRDAGARQGLPARRQAVAPRTEHWLVKQRLHDRGRCPGAWAGAAGLAAGDGWAAGAASRRGRLRGRGWLRRWSGHRHFGPGASP